MNTAEESETTNTAESPPRQMIVNNRAFGALLRRAREDAGYGRARDYCSALEKATGMRLGEKTLLEIERGKQEPTFAEVLGFISTLDPAGGLDYWLSPILPSVQDKIRRLMSQSVRRG